MAFRQQEKQLKAAIEKALQAWLQPLRERYPNKQFTDDFLLLKQPDVAACKEDPRPLRDLDTRITFDCPKNGREAFARVALAGEAPDIGMREGTETGIDQLFIFSLVHELGHAFGLDDTYVRGVKNSGGLAHTLGAQPASIMSGGLLHVIKPFTIGEDDKNGIIYIYKYLHEDHPTGDCFFPRSRY